jgi:hypothetical protein
MGNAILLDWRSWREESVEFSDGSDPERSAEEFDKTEAVARVRLALTAGYRTAAETKIFFMQYPDGTTRWFVEIDPKLVPVA